MRARPSRARCPAAYRHSIRQTILRSPPRHRAVIFHCQSGKRTGDNAAQLRQLQRARGLLLEGGLNALEVRRPIPPTSTARKPIELQRQVQIAAGIARPDRRCRWPALVSPWFVAPVRLRRRRA